MSNNYSFNTTGKRTIISLHRLSHEVCVAVTQEEYWKKVRFRKTKEKSRKMLFVSLIVSTEFKYFNNNSWNVYTRTIRTIL